MKLKRILHQRRFFKKEDGAALIELIAAIAILSLVVTSFLAYFIQSAQTTKSSEEIIDATYLAQQEMENLYSISQDQTREEVLNKLRDEYGYTETADPKKTSLSRTLNGVNFTLEITGEDNTNASASEMVHYLLIGKRDGQIEVQLENVLSLKRGNLDAP